MTVFAAVIALVIGLTLGVLGAGGSILTVPALVLALHVEPKLAIVMGLPIVGGAALVGAIRHWIRRDVHVPVALAFGLASMAGAYIGALGGRHLDGRVQLGVLVAAMLSAATLMLRDAAAPRVEFATDARHITPALLAAGVGAGLLTGVGGVGGGFILVPVLVLLAKLPMRAAVGTSLTVIVMNTSVAFMGYHGVVEVPWRQVLFLGACVAVGVLVGGTFADKLPERRLKQAFAVLLVLVALGLGWKAVTG